MRELKIDINQLKNGEVELQISQQFQKKYYPRAVIKINENSDIDENMKDIDDQVQKWIVGNLNVHEIKSLQTEKSNLTRLATCSELSDIRTGKFSGKILNEVNNVENE